MTWSIEVRKAWLEILRRGEAAKAALEAMGVSYLALAAMTGGCQPFHATRTGGFRVMSADDFASGDAKEA
jgi:hypothetical protein